MSTVPTGADDSPASETAARSPAAADDDIGAMLRRLIRDVPDYPKPGIVFKDITPLLADATAFSRTIRALAEPWRHAGIDTVVGIEARGFILAAPLALELSAGLVPVRKHGKLPPETVVQSYELEYGQATLELRPDAFAGGGKRALIVDDVLATGGTVEATTKLLDSVGAEVVGIGMLLELTFLGGRNRLAGHDLHVLLSV